MNIGLLWRCPKCGAYVMVTYIDTAGTHWWCPVCKETDRGYTYTYSTSTDYNELPRDKIREGIQEGGDGMTKREFLDIVFEVTPKEANKIMDAFDKYVESNEPHWIPVTEKTLPDKNRVVVVCGEKGTWDYGTYRGHGDDIHFWHWKKNTFKHVYWWMYKEDALQMPYKGKE